MMKNRLVRGISTSNLYYQSKSWNSVSPSQPAPSTSHSTTSQPTTLQSTPISSSSSSSNVDLNEVNKFSRNAGKWWKQQDGGQENPFSMLHKMNPVRMDFVMQETVNFIEKGRGQKLADWKVLDVGCGGGILTKVSKWWLLVAILCKDILFLVFVPLESVQECSGH